MEALFADSTLTQNTYPLLAEETASYHLVLTVDAGFMRCQAQVLIKQPADECMLPAAETVTPAVVASRAVATAGTRVCARETLPLAADLVSLLWQAGIRKTIDSVAVDVFCSQLAQGLTPEPMVVARGIAPQKGQDGWLELRVRVFGSGIELREDGFGQVDLKDLNRFSAIEANQKLAIVHSPGKGVAGMTVQGFSVAAEDGQPYTLIAGEGVVLKYDRRVAFASKTGKAVLEKNVLKVVDVLTIRGDVDLTVGDIDFNGMVEITGDVPDDFDVKASGELHVCGAVGACQIEAGGDIVLGSMAGKEIGTIICRGNLTARFLNQVSVYCYGNVTINNEIRHCRVKATGRIVVERGSILGGSCIAYAGIEAQEIGAPSGVKTIVTSGIYFPDEDRFVYLHRRRQQIGEQLAAISEATVPLEHLILQRPELAGTARKRLEILRQQQIRLRAEQQATEAELQASSRQQPEGCNLRINVHKRLYEGVEIHLGSEAECLSQGLHGPISVTQDSQRGLWIMPLSERSVTVGQQRA